MLVSWPMLFMEWLDVKGNGPIGREEKLSLSISVVLLEFFILVRYSDSLCFEVR